VLQYCKQVYPDRHITNVVEGNHNVKLGSWCTIGSTRCIGNSNWVRPYRCLEGPFQSDALLVPEQCQFDHIHNQTQCRTFNEWNTTAMDTCRGREMILRSFAILLPCGIDLFSGVEFVCCPTSVKQLIKASYGQQTLDNEQDEDYYADEEDTYYSDQQFTEMPTTESTTTKKAETTQDVYLTHYLPRSEHQDYKKAEGRFEEKHKERVSKLMKEWTNIQADFKNTNNQNPEEVKLKMATKYQTSLKELEDQHQAERRQLVAMHQQRVISRFEERKQESLLCYSQALKKSTQNVHRIRKCLEKVLKALHKERQHSITQFERLLASSVEAAIQEKEATVLHLAGIDQSIKENLDLLNDYPLLKEKVAPLMQDYLTALRTKDSTAASSLFMDKQAERDMLEALVKRRVSANRVELAKSVQGVQVVQGGEANKEY